MMKMRALKVRGIWFTLAMIWTGVLIAACIGQYKAAARHEKIISDIAKECEAASKVSKIARDFQTASSLVVMCVFEPDEARALQARAMFDAADDSLASLVLVDAERYANFAHVIGMSREYLDVETLKKSKEPFSHILFTSTTCVTTVNAEAAKIIESHTNVSESAKPFGGDKAIPLVVVGVGVMIFGGMLASLRTPQVDQDESQPEI
jgi:hypothetical protein